MPSPPAIGHDTVYHIFNRGNNRENLFIEERNYTYFLTLYLKHICPIVETYAFCLLRNHFHLLVKILDPEAFSQRGVFRAPYQCFSNLFNAYAKSINLAYNRSGSLFQNPFGRVTVTSDEQFLQTVRYIHHNPQNHGLTEDFRSWPFSSYHALLSDDPTFLSRKSVFERFGGRQAFIIFHSMHHTSHRLPATGPSVEVLR